MAKMIDLKPNYNGEAKVWEKLNEYLPNDMVVYNQREINGREYDFCVLAENLGILIIEVKGWISNKLKVNGVDDIEVDGYVDSQGSPKKQARAYRFAMLNKISAKFNVSPLVLDMVCYPFISEEEYKNIRLDIISEPEYTLFKEDIEDANVLNQKICNVFALNNGIPHAEFTYDLMLRIRRTNEPNLKENSSEGLDLPYSHLYVLPNNLEQSKCKGIVDQYAKGLKTIIFVGNDSCYKSVLTEINETFKKKNINFKGNNLYVGYSQGVEENYTEKVFKAFNLEVYYVDSLNDICDKEICIVEGNASEEERSILTSLSENTVFNLQQFDVEHASVQRDILVEAGAGTGKTFSMVSRIAFLCNKKIDAITNIADELAMVTFTNDAAINMKKRLKQMFINYFVLTGKDHYLKFVEDVDRSNISTIHKFAINILRGESLHTGLGINFRILSNEYKRAKAYDIFLDEFLNEMISSNSNFVNELPVPVYELKKKLMSMAGRLFDKSIDFNLIKPAEMGVTVDNNIPYFNDLLLKVVFPAEATYLEAVRNNNDVDLKESLVELGKILSSGCEMIEDLHTRFLFIDEFQDTDDVQIDIFQKLQKAINADCKLFVVGDLKQSIYRFRGAKLNAFQRLQNGKEKEWQHFRLNRNYRTDRRLLKLFDDIFIGMGKKDILPYKSNEDQLDSDVVKEAEKSELLVEVPCHGKDEDRLLDLLMDTVNAEYEKIEKIMEHKPLSKEERTIAILVRSNWQVENILNAANKKNINIEVSTGGDLFQLPSTLDLYKLLLALTHSTSPLYLVNFIESNYTDLKLDYQKFHTMSELEKLASLNEILDEFFEKRMGISWMSLLNEVYTQPILFMLKKIFDALQPWKIYSNFSNKKRLYIANYEYLLERMIKFSKIDALTLNQVVEYLSINILTGQQQLSRSFDVDDEGIHIICTTIHKSKGLEYGTVILPYTSEDIGDIKKVKLEAMYYDNSFAYTVQFENEIRERNSNFNETKEVTEQIAEESRILYVALTRAIRNFVWINNIDRTSEISWVTLLEV